MTRNELCTILIAALVVAAGVMTTTAADSIRGWRGDGSGKFAAENPPSEWSETKNVIWRVKMPAKSNSQPVIVGDRVFTCAEPNTLLCLDRKSGKILWQRTNSYRDIISEKDWPAVEAELQKATKINQRKREAETQKRKTERELDAADGRNDKKTVAELTTRLTNLEKEIAAINGELKKLPLAEKWKTHPTHLGKNGYTTATPTTDGKHIWAVFGNAVVCCYDLDGKRQWIKKLPDLPHNMFGHSASPVVVGDRLIVNIADTVAMDKATGKELWRTGWGQCWGSMIAVKVGGDDLVVLANGRILRVYDGKRIGRVPWVLSDASPIAKDGTVYFVQNRGGAVTLPESAGDKLELKTLWTTNPPGNRYFSSPVLHDGVIYTMSSEHIFVAIDAKTGRPIYRQRLNVGSGTGYPSVVFAGGNIYASSDNGTTVVVKPGKTFREIARNKLDGFISTPVFAGNRMFLRTHNYLYCIGESK